MWWLERFKALGRRSGAARRFALALLFCGMLGLPSGGAWASGTRDSVAVAADEVDSLRTVGLDDYKQMLAKAREQRLIDSAQRVALERELETLKQSDRAKRDEIAREMSTLQASEQARREELRRQRARVDSLRNASEGYPVLGPLNDTVFVLYGPLGAYDGKRRAEVVTDRLQEVYKEDLIATDSVSVERFDTYWNVCVGSEVVHTVTENDALWANISSQRLTQLHAQRIDATLREARAESSVTRTLIRVAKVIAALAVTTLVIILIVKLLRRAEEAVIRNRKEKLHPIIYRNYTLLSEQQIKQAIRSLIRLLKWVLMLISLYLLVPVILGIFSETRGWSDKLFALIINPFKRLGLAIWNYLPNLFAIFAILVVVHYTLRLIRYFFREISTGRLKLPGFHEDWSKPTFTIVRALVYAFTLVLVFPYLPGSDSPVFQGVGVFLGLLLSLGSSSAIANIVAGIVITYMRPFKLGDRIRVGDTLGDVVEKGLLVTRIRSVTNEEVTIPNSTLLSAKTLNYETYSQPEEQGAMAYVLVSYGYDVPWQDVQDLLLEAARRTGGIESTPAPFVLQMELADNGVVYQIVGYTRQPKALLSIRSSLYANIMDVSAERGVELQAVTYYAQRDGSMSTVPPYPPADESYVPPSRRAGAPRGEGEEARK